MKKLFLSIFYYITTFFKAKKFKSFEKKLQTAIVNKHKEKFDLMNKIKKEIDALWPKGISKYIPLSYPQRIELRAKIYSKFGAEMKKLNLELNSNLQFK